MSEGRRIIDNGGVTYILPVSERSTEWYYCLDLPYGDLYEAEEIFRMGRELKGTAFYLFKYPSGERFQPVQPVPGVCMGRPVMENGLIYMLSVDFPGNMINIDTFDCDTHCVKEAARISLDEVEDCYNLMLHERSVTLSRQPNDDTFHIIWPEKLSFPIGRTESFYFRDGNELYFSRWFEDPDYREETVVRDASDGKLIAVFPGTMTVMPGGEKWFIK